MKSVAQNFGSGEKSKWISVADRVVVVVVCYFYKAGRFSCCLKGVVNQELLLFKSYFFTIFKVLIIIVAGLRICSLRC